MNSFWSYRFTGIKKPSSNPNIIWSAHHSELHFTIRQIYRFLRFNQGQAFRKKSVHVTGQKIMYPISVAHAPDWKATESTSQNAELPNSHPAALKNCTPIWWEWLESDVGNITFGFVLSYAGSRCPSPNPWKQSFGAHKIPSKYDILLAGQYHDHKSLSILSSWLVVG